MKSIQASLYLLGTFVGTFGFQSPTEDKRHIFFRDDTAPKATQG